MDQFLDAMYGTRENIGISDSDYSDLEKNAEAELLVEALQSEGYNEEQMNQLSNDDIVKVAFALFGEDSAIVKEAMEGEKCKECDKEPCECKKEDKKDKKDPPPFVSEKEASAETETEKVAHADYLGRVMAHSFIDEMAQMEKKAAYEQVKQTKLEKLASNVQAQQEPAPADPAQSVIAKLAAAKTAAQAPTQEQELEALVDQLAQEKLAAFLKEAGVEVPQVEAEPEFTEEQQMKIAAAYELLQEAGVPLEA